MTTRVYSSRQAARISGLSPRQLAYWRKSGLLAPSHCTAGGHARYTFTDLIALKSARQLLDAGVSPQKLRHALDGLRRFLPTLQQPLAEITVVATGDVMLVLRGDNAFEALSGQQWIFPVARMAREIRHLQREHAGDTPQQGELFPEPRFRPARQAPVTAK